VKFVSRGEGVATITKGKIRKKKAQGKKKAEHAGGEKTEGDQAKGEEVKNRTQGNAKMQNTEGDNRNNVVNRHVKKITGSKRRNKLTLSLGCQKGSRKKVSTLRQNMFFGRLWATKGGNPNTWKL